MQSIEIQHFYCEQCLQPQCRLTSGQSGSRDPGDNLALNHPVECLKARNKELEAQKVQLQARLESAEKALAASTTAEAERERQVLDLETEVARLRTSVTGVQDVIPGSPSTQLVTDDEVIRAFREVRYQAWEIAYSPVFDLRNIPSIPEIENPALSRFYRSCQNLRKKEDLDLRVRGFVFSILYDHILSTPCFGLIGSKISGTVSDEDPVLWDMEESFMKFEQFLHESRNVDTSNIAEWRMCTLNCIERLKFPEGFSAVVAGRVLDFLSPLLSKQTTKSQQTAWRDGFLELCRRCVALTIMMRRSKQEYVVRSIKSKTPFSKVDSWAEVINVENSGMALSYRSSEVAYTLFGALIKLQSENKGGGDDDGKGRQWNVLQKAEVVLDGRRA